MAVINTNITSLIGQQNLNKSASSLQTAMERLSSGSRINSAKDDAAGQAIANRMTAQITGLAQAQRNANDGISVAQTTEGALNQVNDNLQRIRELTVQAQNDTNSAEDKQSIQDEINQRLEEIDRISRETDFNGTKVLSSDNNLSIQVGAKDGEVISLNLKEINRNTLGLSAFNIDGSRTANTSATGADLTNAGFSAGTPSAEGVTTYTKSTAAASIDNVLAAMSDGDTITVGGNDYTKSGNNFTATIDSTQQPATDASAVTAKTNAGATTSVNTLVTDSDDGQMYVKNVEDGTTTFYKVRDSDINSGDQKVTITDFSGMESTSTIGNEAAYSSAAIVKVQDVQTASTLSTTIASSGATASIGTETYNIADSTGSNAVTKGTNTVYYDSASTSLTDTQTTITYTGTTDSNGQEIIKDSEGKTIFNDDSTVATGDFTTDGAYDDPSAASTSTPLDSLDDALSIVDSLRSEMGAMQNRFDSAITNLSTTETNLSAARSRIEDADYATEVANMTKAQILQQAGTSVLAQANQVPQGVLSLLQ